MTYETTYRVMRREDDAYWVEEVYLNGTVRIFKRFDTTAQAQAWIDNKIAMMAGR